MCNKHGALLAILCIFLSTRGITQVDFSDSASLKSSIEKFIQIKLNNEIFPEDDTAKIYGVKDDEYWETDEKGLIIIHNNVKELIAYKADTQAINFQRAQLKEIHIAYEITELHIRTIGENMIIANYKLIQHTLFNNEPCIKLIRVTEVDKQKGNSWKTLAYHETIIPGTPIPYPKAKTTLYANYVGEYKLLSNLVFKVTLVGQKLMWGRKQLIDLIPEDENTFVLNGRVARIRFERNEKGTVKSLRVIEFAGVEYTAIKIE